MTLQPGMYFSLIKEDGSFDLVRQDELNFDTSTMNVQMGEELKKEGMARAALSRAELLQLAKDGCRIAAQERGGTATADDGAEFLISMGYDPAELGNAAGSLFRGKEWHFTGEWRVSARVSNHGRMNRVWRLA